MISSLAGEAFPDATDWIVSRLYVAGGLAIASAPFAIGSLGDQIGIARSFWVVGAIGAIGLLASPLLRRMLAQVEARIPVAAEDPAGV